MNWPYNLAWAIPAWIALCFLIGLLLGALGCAMPPRVYDYPGLGLSVHVAGPYQVHKACYRHGMKKDDGGPIFDEKINGCWKEDAKEIWVREDMPGTLIHELAHADGTYTKEEADKIHFD